MNAYGRPADVAVVVGDDGDEVVVYLAPMPDGPVQVLNGIGSLIWLEATDPSSHHPDVVDRVAAMVGQSPADIRDDVEAFLGDLQQKGLVAVVGRAG